MTWIFGERAGRKFYGEEGEAAWRDCESGALMLSFAVDAGVDRRLVTRAACAIARSACMPIGRGAGPAMLAMSCAEDWAKFKGSRSAARRAADLAWIWAKSLPSARERMAAMAAALAARCSFDARLVATARSSLALATASYSDVQNDPFGDAMAEPNKRFAGFVRGVIKYEMLAAAMEDNP